MIILLHGCLARLNRYSKALARPSLWPLGLPILLAPGHRQEPLEPALVFLDVPARREAGCVMGLIFVFII